MDFRTPDLPDVWLEPPEEASAGAFLELGLPCLAPELPGTKLGEQGPGGPEPGGSRGCGLRELEPEDVLKLLIDPNEVYRSEASPGGDSGISEDPGHADSPAPRAAASPALCEVVYEAGGPESRPGEAGPAEGLPSLQLGPQSPPLTVPAVCTAREPPGVGTVTPVPPASPPQEASWAWPEPVWMKFPSLTSSHSYRFLSTNGDTPEGAQGAWPWGTGKGRPSPPLADFLCSPPAAPWKLVPDRGGEAAAGTGGGFPAHSLAPHQGRGEGPQEGQEEDPQQAVGSGQSAAEEGVHRRAREQGRRLFCTEPGTTEESPGAGEAPRILLFSLALIILPSVSPLQGLREAGNDDHQPQGVISRNILTHKDMTESLDTVAAESQLEGPPRARGVNGSTRNLLEKRGRKTGPSGHVRTVLPADEM